MKKKIQAWRIIVFIIAVIVIIATWVKKDVGAMISQTPQEQVLPMVLTSVAVTLVKVGLIAGAVLLIRWIVIKIKNRKQE